MYRRTTEREFNRQPRPPRQDAREASWQAAWDSNPSIRAEFGSPARYYKYRQRLAQRMRELTREWEASAELRQRFSTAADYVQHMHHRYCGVGETVAAIGVKAMQVTKLQDGPIQVTESMKRRWRAMWRESRELQSEYRSADEFYRIPDAAMFGPGGGAHGVCGAVATIRRAPSGVCDAGHVHGVGAGRTCRTRADRQVWRGRVRIYRSRTCGDAP